MSHGTRKIKENTQKITTNEDTNINRFIFFLAYIRKTITVKIEDKTN